jgi:hypothetical protein
MPTPSGRSEGDRTPCNCEKCARMGGQVLARNYLAEIENMLSQPAPSISKRCKQSFRGEPEELRTRVSNRAAGQSTVRTR